jgi:hypothetical protein
MTTDLTAAAIAVLQTNDRGGHAAPTSSAPAAAQRNWESCLAALGLVQFDEDRAWTEIETLLGGQGPDGMVPHTLVHGGRAGPPVGPPVGPREPGRTHPPLATSVVRHLFERCGVQRSRPRLRVLAPKLLAWHRWFGAARDPEGTGLAAIVDPRESGMEGSPVWNTAQAPFRVADIGFNAILQRANRDLRFLLDMIDDRAGMAEVDRMIARTRAALETCWDRAGGLYHSRDTRTGQGIGMPGIGGFLPLYADPTLANRHPELPARLERWLDQAAIAVPSLEPGRPEFDPRRPWCGPVSPALNWMLHDGLRRAGRQALAARIRRDSMAVVERSGFREYFDPITGEGSAAPTSPRPQPWCCCSPASRTDDRTGGWRIANGWASSNSPDPSDCRPTPSPAPSTATATSPTRPASGCWPRRRRSATRRTRSAAPCAAAEPTPSVSCSRPRPAPWSTAISCRS